MKTLILIYFLFWAEVFHVNAQYPAPNASQIHSLSQQNHLNFESSSVSNDSVAGSWDHLTINSDYRIYQLLEIKREESIRKKGLDGVVGIDGFRTQIFQGTKDEAYKVKSRFLSKYPDVKIYVLFQTPDFKVRIGDFRERSEAIQMKYVIINDFPNSLIVEDVIHYPDLKKENRLGDED